VVCPAGVALYNGVFKRVPLKKMLLGAMLLGVTLGATQVRKCGLFTFNMGHKGIHLLSCTSQRHAAGSHSGRNTGVISRHRVHGFYITNMRLRMHLPMADYIDLLLGVTMGTTQV
jgi:hypothetical protein